MYSSSNWVLGDLMAVEEELALRLAWYLDKYGPIPPREQRRLTGIGHGIATGPNEAELANLSREILDYVRSLDVQSPLTSN